MGEGVRGEGCLCEDAEHATRRVRRTSSSEKRTRTTDLCSCTGRRCRDVGHRQQREVTHSVGIIKHVCLQRLRSKGHGLNKGALQKVTRSKQEGGGGSSREHSKLPNKNNRNSGTSLTQLVASRARKSKNRKPCVRVPPSSEALPKAITSIGIAATSTSYS